MRKYIRNTMHRNILEDFLKKNSSLFKNKIIDIGSANRRYDHLFTSKITAVDIVENNKKDVVFGDLEKGLGFQDDSFSGALCIEVFEYLDNYEKAIVELSRILEKDGTALVSMPFLYPQHGDNIRFTDDFISGKFKNYFSDVNMFHIGNGFTLIWDILRLKVFRLRPRFFGRVLFLFLLPYLGIMKLFRLDKKIDKFYSGLFFVLKK